MGRIGNGLPLFAKQREEHERGTRLAEDVRASARRVAQTPGRFVPCEHRPHQCGPRIPSTPGLLHGYWAGTPENRVAPEKRGLALAGTSILPNHPR